MRNMLCGCGREKPHVKSTGMQVMHLDGSTKPPKCPVCTLEREEQKSEKSLKSSECGDKY